MRVALLALALGGCITDRAIELELSPPRGPDGAPTIPEDVRAHEVRLYRVEDGEGCPDLETAALAAPFGELAHAQSFEHVEGMGEAIGELPPGAWAVAAISRDGACAPRLFGCTSFSLGSAPASIVVQLTAASSGARCGCRSCELGACTPTDAICP